jgi:hypothetical protein
MSNYKNALNEYAQKHRLPMPTYTSERFGPDHTLQFVAVCTFLNQQYQGEMRPTKVDAEKSAAEAAYRAVTEGGVSARPAQRAVMAATLSPVPPPPAYAPPRASAVPRATAVTAATVSARDARVNTELVVDADHCADALAVLVTMPGRYERVTLFCAKSAQLPPAAQQFKVMRAPSDDPQAADALASFYCFGVRLVEWQAQGTAVTILSRDHFFARVAELLESLGVNAEHRTRLAAAAAADAVAADARMY